MAEVVVIEGVWGHVYGTGWSDGLPGVPLDGVHAVIIVTVNVIMMMVTGGASTPRL